MEHQLKIGRRKATHKIPMISLLCITGMEVIFTVAMDKLYTIKSRKEGHSARLLSYLSNQKRRKKEKKKTQREIQMVVNMYESSMVVVKMLEMANMKEKKRKKKSSYNFNDERNKYILQSTALAIEFSLKKNTLYKLMVSKE